MRVSYKIEKTEAAKIRERMKKVTQTASYRRLEAVALLAEGRKPKEVAEITHYGEKHVRTLGCRYNTEGIEALAIDGRVGGNHRLMNEEQSAAFMRQFEEQAEKGQLITIEEIAQKFDQQTGKDRASLSTVYYFLHRNGWRKVMPRAKHPKKASDADIMLAKNKIKN